MKISLSCPQCNKDGSNTANFRKEVEFREDGRYELTCPIGHKTVTVLQANRYEILYDLGAYAIEDGYYREAVNSFTAALERFYEFFIKAVLLDNKSGKDFDKVFTHFWKKVSNNSERQFGAFVMLYTKEFEELPRLLSNSKVEFRNAVVHKGRIPSSEEAIGYGQEVMDVIRATLKRLKERWPDGKIKAILHDQTSLRKPEDGDRPLSSMLIMTILNPSIAQPEHNERSLEEALAVLKTYGRVMTKLRP